MLALLKETLAGFPLMETAWASEKRSPNGHGGSPDAETVRWGNAADCERNTRQLDNGKAACVGAVR